MRTQRIRDFISLFLTVGFLALMLVGTRLAFALKACNDPSFVQCSTANASTGGSGCDNMCYINYSGNSISDVTTAYNSYVMTCPGGYTQSSFKYLYGAQNPYYFPTSPADLYNKSSSGQYTCYW